MSSFDEGDILLKGNEEEEEEEIDAYDYEFYQKRIR